MPTGYRVPPPLPGPARRLFLAGLGALLATPALARAPATSPRPAPRPDRGTASVARAGVAAASDVVAASGLAGAVGFVLADMRTGRVIEAREEGQALPPASSIKAVTALYALEALGPRYRYVTRVLLTGPVSDGEVQGDMILQGGGDPTLDTDGIALLVGRLRAAGLRGGRGRFLVDDQALPFVRAIDATQPDHVGYNPSVSGLNLNYNRIHFEWTAQGGSHVLSLDARSARLRPAVRMVDIRAVDR
ncbi:MAG: D-alanyl-D-alanine carboxypeptidase, partial [Rhodobacteraceae bacterium]|nr:D-alanyl-D-alanine carboxypeptidase [Paracoccaceae bacterium]